MYDMQGLMMSPCHFKCGSNETFTGFPVENCGIDFMEFIQKQQDELYLYNNDDSVEDSVTREKHQAQFEF